MINNADVMDVLAYGTKEQIEALPHFISQGPTVSFKCNMALETKLAVDVTLDILRANPTAERAEIYRHVALLQDRSCVSCKQMSSKVSCVAGSFRCANCNHRRSSADHYLGSGYEEWVSRGMPIRHGIRTSDNNV